MAKIAYETWKLRPASRRLVEIAEAICDDYAAQGYQLTLRQLFYQFVARGHIENSDSSYEALGDKIKRARLSGMLDWDSIVDRTRNLRSNSHWDSPSHAIDSIAQQYAIDSWEDQPTRVEIWVEKDALAGIVERAASPYDCAWFSCRGYISLSELWGAAQRHLGYLEAGQRVVVVHLGDHDPSGIDMTRDITDRLNLFLEQDWRRYYGGSIYDQFDAPITVNRIALNMDQIEQYRPPPNPTKLTDSRSPGYIRQFGYESWELDALEPSVLGDLIEDAILEVVDLARLEARRAVQEDQRGILLAASRRWPEVRAFLENGEAS